MQTGGKTDVTNLIVAFRHFAYAPKIKPILIKQQLLCLRFLMSLVCFVKIILVIILQLVLVLKRALLAQ